LLAPIPSRTAVRLFSAASPLESDFNPREDDIFPLLGHSRSQVSSPLSFPRSPLNSKLEPRGINPTFYAMTPPLKQPTLKSLSRHSLRSFQCNFPSVLTVPPVQPTSASKATDGVSSPHYSSRAFDFFPFEFFSLSKDTFPAPEKGNSPKGK